MRRLMTLILILIFTSVFLPPHVLAQEPAVNNTEDTEEYNYEEENGSSGCSSEIEIDPCRHGSVSIQEEMASWNQLRYIVTAVPDDRYCTSLLTAVDEDGNSVVAQTGDNYIVVYDNNCHITVHAEFTCIAPAIYTNSKNGHIAVKVNGMETDEVKPGDTVELEFIPDRAYVFRKNMYFVCEEQPEAEWDGNICTFVMPDCGDLGVYASFDWLMKRHIFLRSDPERADIQPFVEGTESKDGFAGDAVSLKASIKDDEYEITGIRIENHLTGETMAETSRDEVSFTMPDSDVDVYVLCGENKHSITIDNSGVEHVSVLLRDDNGVEKTEFKTGERVWVSPLYLDDRYALCRINLSAVESGTVHELTYSDSGMYFTMPQAEVILTLFEAIRYTDENGKELFLEDCRKLSDFADTKGAVLQSGWYIADRDLSFLNRVTVSGDVNLILMDGVNLRMINGIHNAAGSGSLSIWGQKQGTGTMTCESLDYQAAIGGGYAEAGGIFNQYGGNITAKGAIFAAAIGGGRYGSGGITRIYRGSLNVRGGKYGAGIGGGASRDGGHIEIYGGTITAESYDYGAGIGGGIDGNGGEIRIYGGNITAKAGTDAAAIGGGEGGNGGTILISDGSVRADAYKNGSAIGGGESADGGSITITGGTVIAKGYSSPTILGGAGAGIGGGDHGSGGTICITGGTIEAYGGSGDIGNGAGIGGGSCADGGTISVKNGYVTAKGGSGSAGIGGGNGGSGGTIELSGGTIKAYGGEGEHSGGAGIGGGDNSEAGNISISGGSIYAEGKNGGAGIGGGNDAGGGRIEISGGYIDARGGFLEDFLISYSGAGIGGGDDGDSGVIIISGGEIYAQATIVEFFFDYAWGAGIGAGDDGDENEITITGGHISAHGNQAVGCGEDGDNGILTLADHIWTGSSVTIFPYDMRYTYARAHDIELFTR